MVSQQYRCHQAIFLSIDPIIHLVKESGYDDGSDTFDPTILGRAIFKVIRKLAAPSRHHLLREVMRIDQKNYGSLRAYLDRLRYLVERFEKLGVGLSDSICKSVMLEGLQTLDDPEWINWLMEQSEDRTLTYLRLRALICIKVNEQILKSSAQSSIKATTPAEETSPGTSTIKRPRKPTPSQGPSPQPAPCGTKFENVEASDAKPPAGKRMSGSRRRKQDIKRTVEAKSVQHILNADDASVPRRLAEYYEHYEAHFPSLGFGVCHIVVY